MLPPEYFRDNELECHCGCGLLPQQKDVECLYALRIKVNVPFPVSSAARCKKYNRSIGGKAGSIHLPESHRRGNSSGWGGGAFDIVADADLQAKIYAAGILVGFMGFGFGDTFIHIDNAKRPRVAVWRY